MKRVPSLDGLRAISISLVLVMHMLLHVRTRGAMQAAFISVVGAGETGVSIFFVISGFLITLLLLQEKQATGRISLSAFYLRRAFRILPALLVYIGVMAVLARLHLIEIPLSHFVHALTFTLDYVEPKNWWLGQWSLSVEEQFYVLWPLLVFACSRRTLTRAAIGVIVAEPFIRFADRFVLPSTRYEIIYMAHTRADMLMFGCLVALLYDNPSFVRTVEVAFRKNLPTAAAIFLFLISPLLEWKLRGQYLLTIGYTLQGLCIGLLMLFAIKRSDGSVGRFLNAAPVVWVGVISYSLFLWHQPFIGFIAYSTKRSILGIVFAVPAAVASYYLVEKPMLRVKRRFEVRRTPLAKASEPSTSMV